MRMIQPKFLAPLLVVIVSTPAFAAEKVSGPLTLVQLESVQREHRGADEEELSIDAYDAFTKKPAQLRLQRQARGSSEIMESCEKYALIVMSRPDKWQLVVYLSASNRELASFETVQRERTEWRVMKADLDHLGGSDSLFRCGLQRAGTRSK